MKILHTADWHLGQRLHLRERYSEHEQVLNWLLELIREQAIDYLLVCGDVFDVDNPPLEAQRLYYNFFQELAKQGHCQSIVIAGNHDSGNFLRLTQTALGEDRSVRMVGYQEWAEQPRLIPLRHPKTGQLEGVVAAIPYLRDRDLRRQAKGGETTEERIQQLRQGLRQYYHEASQQMISQYGQDLPLIATGHLFVQGSERDGRLNIIHIGSLDALSASDFPTKLDYVALGHLHRPQAPAPKVHYSGSILPMDFNEYNYDQIVKILHFEGKSLQKIESVKIPLPVRMRAWRGEADYLWDKIKSLDDQAYYLKLELEIEAFSPQIEQQFRSWLAENKTKAQLLLFRQLPLMSSGQEEFEEQRSLEESSEEEVFKLLLHSQQRQDEDGELLSSFRELLAWMKDEKHQKLDKN
jgi:exonuclease SbcD